MSTESWDIDADVIIVGSGGAGLCAALVASYHGARTIILEKTPFVGGTTAISGGGIWLPCNHLMTNAGYGDSPEEALNYIRSVLPAQWESEEGARWHAFLREGPKMLSFLEANSQLRFDIIPQADAFPDAPGGKQVGRLITPIMLSKKILGRRNRLLRKYIRPPIFTYNELIFTPLMRRPFRTALGMIHKLAYRLLTQRVGGGAALIVGLLQASLQYGCNLFTSAVAEELLTDPAQGRVVGVRATISGKSLRLSARKAVILATGGFEWNDNMLARYFPRNWTLRGSPSANSGDGHRMAAAVGAVSRHMDQATIYPVSNIMYEGAVHAIPINQLAFPHCILVNKNGERFISEGDRNGLSEALMVKDDSDRSLHLPTWRVFDSQFARNNPFNVRVANWVKNGLRKAGSIEELAQIIQVDAGKLRETIERFNMLVRGGRDLDFFRGETNYEKLLTGDPKRPEWNGALGTIEKPPFYASPYYVGILNTKGGPWTDAGGRALREDGSVIESLFCAGAVAADIFGTRAFSSGGQLGPYLVGGYVCGKNAVLGSPVQGEDKE